MFLSHYFYFVREQCTYSYSYFSILMLIKYTTKIMYTIRHDLLNGSWLSVRTSKLICPIWLFWLKLRISNLVDVFPVTIRYSIYLPRRDWRLSWPGWLVIYRDSLPVSRQPPIQVVTGTGVEQRCWSTPNCQRLYHQLRNNPCVRLPYL